MSATSRNFQIDAPHLLSRRRRVSDAIVTGLMWVLYSYLWAPLISLLAWLLGFEFAYDVMIRAGGISGLKAVLWWYGVVLAGILTVVAAWSAVNRIRFSQHDRRQSGQDIADAELVEHFSLGWDELRKMRSARVSEIRFSAAGSIEQVDASGIENPASET